MVRPILRIVWMIHDAVSSCLILVLTSETKTEIEENKHEDELSSEEEDDKEGALKSTILQTSATEIHFP